MFVGSARLAGFALAVFATVLAALLRASGVDSTYPVLWLLPAASALAALFFFMRPRARTAARVVFGLSVFIFIGTSFFVSRFVDGRAGDIRLGPIPMGTPVNLLMNVNPEASKVDLFNAVSGLARGMLRIDRENLQDGDGRALDAFMQEAGLPLLKVSKCPDFVLDRGHWFAQSLSDDEKKQLKAFLATL